MGLHRGMSIKEQNQELRPGYGEVKTADPAIKVVPPCRIRAHPSSSSQSSVPYEPTPPNSNNSGHMLVDPIPRPEQVGTVIGLAQSSEDSHLINNFSPPLTTSSRSSVALDATPPLSSGGGAVLVVKQDHALNGPPSANFNALVNAAVVQAAELTNHNRLGVATGYVADVNGHHEEKVAVDSAIIPSGALTPAAAKVAAVKRTREPKAEYPEKAKRPRANHRTKSEKALRDLVGPIVSETVSDFHRERIADRTVTTESRRMVTTNATPSTSHDIPVVSQQPIVTAQPAASNLIGTSPLAAARPQGNVGPSNSTLPSSMEQLLERQWEARIAVPHLTSPIRRGSAAVLFASTEIGEYSPGRTISAVESAARTSDCTYVTVILPTSIVSPHHSPIVVASTSVPPPGVEDSLTQLRSLASGTPRPTGRPPSQASAVPSTSSFGASQHGGPGFVPHVQNRTTTGVSSVPGTPSTATLTTASTSQPQMMTATSSAPVVSAELTANISPERLAALNPLINGGFLGRSNQMLGTGNAMDPLITSFLLSQAQHSQQQYLAGNSTANLLARFMMPPISGSNSVQGAGGIGK
ncbi:hypothetical protein COOONC_27320 [Cooperia oncophora]